LERIKITGLNEGTPLRDTTPPAFIFIADGAPDFGIPTIKITYRCFSDTLTVTAALVFQEADYDDND
jgi:hypothetical protein